MTTGCICDWLGIDNIREVEMSDSQRAEYFKEICNKLPSLDPDWFNRFLVWICEEYGEYECSDEPCETCGDIIQTYKITL